VISADHARAYLGRIGSAVTRPSKLSPVLGLAIAVALAMYTTHKLHKMARIRGFIGEPRIERHIVSGKNRAPARRTTVCFLRWTEGGSEHRVQADCAYWEQTAIGDPIELVRLDVDDDEAYLREGDIYASDGNFYFDFVLLAVELVGVIYFVVRLRRRS